MRPRRVPISLPSSVIHEQRLVVVSREIGQMRKYRNAAPNNSVQLEDIFTHLNDEILPYQLGITKLSPTYINPILRDTIFRMPDRPQREATSFALKFKLYSQCLCQKYNYHTLKNHIFRHIDHLFAEYQQKFFHKLQKSLSKQLDIGLFQRDLDDQKAILKLGDIDIMSSVREKARETAAQYWETHAKSVFLHGYSLQQQINDIVRDFSPLHDQVLKNNETIGYFQEDYTVLLQATQFNMMARPFVDNYCTLLDQTQQSLKCTLYAVQQLQIRISARCEQIARYMQQITLIAEQTKPHI